MIKRFGLIDFIFREIKVKRNIILIIVSSIIIIGLFLALTLINNNNEKIDFYTTRYIPNVRFEVVYNDRYKTKIEALEKKLNEIDSDDSNYNNYMFELFSLRYPSEESDIERKLYNKVKEIDHVVEVIPRKYNRELRAEMNDGLSEGDLYHKTIFLKPLQYKSDIKMMYGDYPEKGEIICPPKMYFTRDLEYYSEVLDMKREHLTSIGEEFDIFKDKFNLNTDNTIKLKVVGIYNNNYTFDKLNTCYTSFETYEGFNTSEGYEELEIGGTRYIFPIELLGISVRVDDLKNVGEVQNKIKELGLDIFEYDKVTFVYSNINTPYYIAITSVLLLITILVLFIRKKCIYKKFNYALMEVQGYTDRKILLIESIENILSISLSYMLSIMIFITIFNLTPYSFMYYYEVYGNPLTIPYNLILLSFPLIIMLVVFVTLIVCKKYLKANIITNLEVV